MKTLNYNITKEAILNEASLLSAYAGLKNPDGEKIFSRVALSDEDNELLTRFWTEMTGKVTDCLQSLIKSSVADENSFTIELELSNSYDENLNGSVENDLTMAIANGVTGSWFSLSLPDKASEWKALSESLLLRAFKKLCHRRRPLRGS